MQTLRLRGADDVAGGICDEKVGGRSQRAFGERIVVAKNGGEAGRLRRENLSADLADGVRSEELFDQRAGMLGIAHRTGHEGRHDAEDAPDPVEISRSAQRAAAEGLVFEHLHDCEKQRRALRRRWSGHNAVAAKVHCGGHGDTGFVAAKIIEGEHSPALLGSFDDGGSDRAAIEAVATVPREEFHRAGEVVVGEQRADDGKLAVGQIKAGNLGVAALKFLFRFLEKLVGLWENAKSCAGERDRGLHGLGPRFFAPFLVGRPESGREARHAHGAVAVAAVFH